MSGEILQQALILGAGDMLRLQQPDGSLGAEAWAPMAILPWAICYTQRLPGNPYRDERQVLDAILRLGDHNARSCDEAGCFADNVRGRDEWRLLAWAEATE